MTDNGDHNKAQLPLLGVILCCTSIPPELRSDLASIACRMGAVHKFDLTSDVTHLIVGELDTPKYKFVAKEREDVKCLLPSWVEAVRLSWMEGGETDVEALEKEHQLPTLAGLKICVTGFDDLAYRTKLEELINENGANYRGNLTRDVTHLIAKEPSGSKYTYAGQWGIKIVSIEWLEQSLERGMILEESLYNLLLSPAERGRNAWIRKSVSTTSLGKRPREAGLERTDSRKLRRTASARLSSETAGLWANIVGEGVKKEAVKPHEWQEDSNPELPVPVEGRSANVLQTSGEQRFRDSPAAPCIPKPIKAEATRGGIFSGKTFILHGFDEKRSAILRHHLLSHEARLLPDELELPQASKGSAGSYFLLVPHQMHKRDVPVIPSGLQQPLVATEMLVERCLLRKQFVPLADHITNTPFQHFPIQGFENLDISVTAFQDVDLLHTSKTIQLMGAKHTEDLTPSTSVLVCNKIMPNSEKRVSAAQWNVPTVGAEWLWDCIREGQLLPFDAYLTQPCQPKRSNRPVDPKTSENSNKKDHLQQGQQSETGANGKAAAGSNLRSSTIRPTQPASSLPSASNSNINRTRSHDSTKPAPEQTIAHHSSGPLQPLSINLSPKPSPSPPKPIPTETESEPQACKPASQPASPIDTLGPAISSLLAAHQRASANASNNPQARPERRRRELLGRAPSNLSARSLSRASSVDTLNTDGVGTPISGSFPHFQNHAAASAAHTNNPPNCKQKQTDTAKDPFAKLREYAQEVELEEKGEQEVQLTQLGYEDPHGKVWRERVVRKMGGVVEEEGEEGAEREVVRDIDAGPRKGGIAGRTRAAAGR